MNYAVIKTISRRAVFFSVLLIFCRVSHAIDLLSGATNTVIDTQLNTSSWAASRLLDGSASTRWLSRYQANNLNYIFNAGKDEGCFDSLDFTNYGADDRSISRFMLLYTETGSLSSDTGTAGWTPLVADPNPAYLINYASWAQGGRLVGIDAQLNTTSWAAQNMHDGDTASRWLSRKATNTMTFTFDTDWDGTATDSINVKELKINNYGTDDRSVKLFQVHVTQDGSTWIPLEVPSTGAGDEDFNFTRVTEGGELGVIDAQLNTTSWAAANVHDGDANSRWLSRKSNNTLDFAFDVDDDGTTGLAGDTADAFTIKKIYIQNYGTDDRSVKNFQVEVKTIDEANWVKLEVPGSNAGEADFNFALQNEGGQLTAIDAQLNTSSWAAANVHDNDSATRWLSRKSNNTLDFRFDTDGDGTTGAAGDADDHFLIETLYLKNYGTDDRSIRQFQVEVKTDGNANWTKLEVPGSVAGEADYNFTLNAMGGSLSAIDAQLNTSSWSAANIHDGNDATRWLSRKQSNTLDFLFDPDGDSTTGGAGDVHDYFTIEKIYLKNYGTDDRSVKEFQVEVKTSANGNWTKLEVPGSTAGEADYDFTGEGDGGVLVGIDAQHNTSSWAAANIHDGSDSTRWLSRKSNNTLDFQFDPDGDATTGAGGDTDDYFTIEKIYLKNYGADDRSVKEFQVEVKTTANANWTKLEVPGSTAGEADYNFTGAGNGGALVAIDAQHNTSTWAAANIHDGSDSTRWLSRKSNNTLDFQFDPDGDATTGAGGDTDDYFTIEKIYLKNYGTDDRSVKDFQVEVKTTANAIWTKLEVPGSSAGDPDFNFTLATNGGALSAINAQLNTSSWAAANVHDGDNNTRWLSRKSGNNTLDFTFDPDADGTTGAAGDNGDRFRIEKIYIRNYGNHGRAVREFQVEVKTSSNANWTKLEVPGTKSGDANYNFALAANGGELTLIDAQHNTTSWAAANIHDGDQNTRWLSRKETNSLEFEFDTNFDGSAGDKINLDTVGLTNYGNDDRSVATFEIDVKINNGGWQAVNAPGGGTVFNANMDRSGQTWAVGPLSNVTAARIRTLTNHGDARYTGAREIVFSGDSQGASRTFTAAKNGSGETFTLDNGDRPNNVVEVRFRTISNHGDNRYIGAREFAVLGDSVVPSTTFSAAMNSAGETFTLDVADRPANVTDVRFRTISNHGDPRYTGAREFRVLGPSLNPSTTFTAAMNSTGETFTLDVADRPANVTDVRFRTISNHGDPSYTGARDFKVLGPSLNASTTFIAAMNATGETFTLDVADRPTNVTAVRFRTVSNHGDPRYTGAREFSVLGPSVTPSHTFTAAMNGLGETFTLDVADRPADVTDVRLRTISNHGDPTYTGAREFGVTGPSLNPSTTFTAAMDGNGETFTLDTDDRPTQVIAVRFRTISNHGDPSYTGAREFSVLGPALGASHTFSVPMTQGPHTITLDNADVVSNVISARFITVQNHGDPSYTGLREFELLGDSVAGDYVFTPTMTTGTQSFSFDATVGKVFRFHSLGNYGDPSYTGAAELVLNGKMGTCSCTLGGFEIVQPDDGLACPSTRATVSIKAMCDDGITVKTDYDGTADLSAGANGSFFIASSGGSAITAYDFNGSELGEKTFYLFNSDVGEDIKVTVSDAAASVATTHASGTDFGAAVFQIETEPANFVCGQSTSVTIRTFGQVGGGSCDVLSGFAGNKNIKAWFNANLDANVGYDLTPTALNVGGTDIDDAGQPGSANLVLNFTAGRSTVDIKHLDAAQIAAIHFLHDDAPYTGTPFTALSVSTSSFVSSPSELELSVTDADWEVAVVRADSTKFKIAGEDFGMDVKAVCGDAATTTAVNYLSQDDIDLGIALLEPAAGTNGVLSTSTVRVDSGAVNGVKSFTQTVSEVGTFTLSASVSAASYFGTTISAAADIEVGRFYPSYFLLSAGSVTAACTTGTNFSYMGQDFTSEFTLTAKDFSGSGTLSNYEGDFAKLIATDLVYGAIDMVGSTDFAVTPPNPARLVESGVVNWVAGVGTVTSTLSISRIASADGPYDQVKLGVYGDDEDSVAIAGVDSGDAGYPGFDLDADNSGSEESMELGETAIRFGRLVAEDAFGPESAALSVIFRAEYWDGDSYVLNATDSCTTIPRSSISFAASTIDVDARRTVTVGSQTTIGSFTTMDASNITLLGGNAGLVFSAPGAGGTGSFTFGVDLTTRAWLKSDWDQDGDENDDAGLPDSTITFGTYRGHDRIIQWQEILR